ncbi:SGNH/GDSL hydrolase family protein [Kutzneria sp. CA-103260]|uniref:SGNH/GDSL hydrolase family protein n=1 Tax=Kutzneria sp. CA-103260 TaxID=2802641 RepID=UPI001BA9D0A0|nr:SGNH/GDSL hydrolase family protein [Kutzneria sp. CA-103260]QUQ64268.1 Lipase 2 [Kutzneria sp. CA-103260]
MTRTRLRGTALGVVTIFALATVLPAPASAQPRQQPVEWTALGDSYTAGVFVGDPQPPLGSSDRDGCDRTTNSYPDVVNRAFEADPPAGRPVNLTNVSCGNATITEIAADRQIPISPVQPPGDGWPSVAPQVNRAGIGAQTDVITIGVGGNSLPVGKIVPACLFAGIGQPDEATPCRDAYEAGGPFLDPESIYDKYDRITRQYAAMLRAVHQTAPHAKVITVGYPTIFPDDPTTCDRRDTTELAAQIKGFGLVSVTHGDIAWLNEVITHLNAIIRAVTELAGDTYVDTATSSKGHDVCQPSSVKWVEGICGHAREYWPTELELGPLTLECSGGTRATIVHPNAAGHAKTAARVETTIRAALN